MDDVDLGIEGLGNYRVIGSGGFATVYGAWDQGFRRWVAVKVLHSLDDAGRRRFDRERGIMGQLSGHGNVVTPYQFGYTADGAPYLVMEYIDGGSLDDVIGAQGPMRWDRAIDHIIPVADALSHGHAQGVLHRDVKPANILITAAGVPKLADYGIAAIRESTATQTAFTLAHSAPETFAGGHDTRDERADLYSLASTMYTLLSGRTPFQVDGADSPAAHMTRISLHPVLPIGAEQCPPPLDAFLARAMAKDPADRWSTASDFVSELQAIRAQFSTGPTSGRAGFAPAPATPHQASSYPVQSHSIPSQGAPSYPGSQIHAQPIQAAGPPAALGLSGPPGQVVAGATGRQNRNGIIGLVAFGAVLLAAVGALGLYVALDDNGEGDSGQLATDEPAAAAGSEGANGDTGEGAAESVGDGASGDDSTDQNGSDETDGESGAGGDESSAPAEVANDGPLVIGGLLPQTGDLAFLGPSMEAGVEAAVNDINAAGGVFREPVIWRPGDSGFDRTIAASTTATHVADGVDVIIGPASSSIALSVVETITGAGIIQISPSNTSVEIGRAPDNGLYFRTAPSDLLQGAALGDLLVADGAASVAFLVLDDPYGTTLLEATKSRFESNGGTVVSEQVYDPNAATFAAEVAAVVAADPDAIVIVGFSETAAILDELSAQGSGPDTKLIYGTDGNMGDFLGSEVGSPQAVTGMRGTLPGVDVPEELPDFRQKLLGVDSGLTDFAYSAESYDAVIVAALAAIAAGTNDPEQFAPLLDDVTGGGTVCTDFATCAQLLADGTDIDYDGLSGPIDFDETGEPTVASFLILEFDSSGRTFVAETRFASR